MRDILKVYEIWYGFAALSGLLHGSSGRRPNGSITMFFSIDRID